MSAHIAPPFRADVVGSLLRSDQLKQARADHRIGKITATRLREIEDRAIGEVVAMQEQVGLKVASDGELRRATYSENFTTSGLTGITTSHSGTGDWAYSDGHGSTRKARIPRVIDRIRWRGGAGNTDDFQVLAAAVTRALPKFTLPGPSYIYHRAGRDNISRDVYPSLDGFWADLSAAYQAEIAALYDAGCRYLQLDDTAIAKLGDPEIQRALARRGDDWQHLLATYIDVINAVIAGAPPDLHIALHVCRGNQAGHWQAAGGYDVVAGPLFTRLDVSTIFMEYDSPRAGTFAPLRWLPDDKVVVLGLVSTKVAALESPDAIRSRIAEAARIVPLDRLCLSPQCGFASSEAGNPLSEDQQRAKLKLVVDVAQEVWGA